MKSNHELYKIWDFHGSDYGDPGLLEHDAVWFGEWNPLTKPQRVTSQKPKSWAQIVLWGTSPILN